MAVPVPCDLSLGSPPNPWSAQSPGLTNALAEIIAENLTGELDIALIKGKVRGGAPNHDIGPWLNGEDWYVWSAKFTEYEPSEQGCPVGTVAFWAGISKVPDPSHWLLCQGQAISRAVYYKLFSAIGTTWGVGDGSSTFNLPPSGLFLLNNGSLELSSEVPITSGTPGQPGVIGGSKTVTLVPQNLPRLIIKIPALSPELIPITAGLGYANVEEAGAFYSYDVTDEHGVVLGPATPFNILPPYVAMNLMIRYW